MSSADPTGRVPHRGRDPLSTSGPAGPAPASVGRPDRPRRHPPAGAGQAPRHQHHPSTTRPPTRPHARGRGKREPGPRAGRAKTGKSGRGGRGKPLGVVHRIDKETSGLAGHTRTCKAANAGRSRCTVSAPAPSTGATSPIAHGDVRPRPRPSGMLVENRGDGLRGSAKGKAPGDAREGDHPRRAARGPARRDALVACAPRDGPHAPDPHPPERGGPSAAGREGLHPLAGRARPSRPRA